MNEEICHDIFFSLLGICLIFPQCKAEKITYDAAYDDMKDLLQEYQNLGWHLESIDGYPNYQNSHARYAAIWKQDNTPDTRKITIGKSWVDFQQEWNENIALGMFSVFIELTFVQINCLRLFHSFDQNE